jgi:hypothetical protein
MGWGYLLRDTSASSVFVLSLSKDEKRSVKDTRPV